MFIIFWRISASSVSAWNVVLRERYARLQIKEYRVSDAPDAWVTILHDDLLHPVMGGNKLRKLDALLPTLQPSGITDVVRASLRDA